MKYAYWLLVGVLVGLGIAALLTIGVALLLAAAVLTLIGLRTPALRGRAVLAVPAGVGLSALYLAWLNRGGPGRVCDAAGTSITCTDRWSPWPFVVVAAVLVAVSVIFVRATRR